MVRIRSLIAGDLTELCLVVDKIPSDVPYSEFARCSRFSEQIFRMVFGGALFFRNIDNTRIRVASSNLR
jgi:hypothetical protein